MLKGLDPLLSPELLQVLASMGHGDEVAIVDANFPAASHAQRLVRLSGISTPRALEAVLSVLPLDDFGGGSFGGGSAFRMQVVDDPSAMLPIFDELRETVARHDHAAAHIFGALERHAFYARTKAAYAVIATGETRLYGNILLVKGVVRAVG
jgi:L-fucose mutarotase